MALLEQIDVKDYAAIADALVEELSNYTATQTRSWITSGVESAAKEPYILHTYGEFWVRLKGAISLADQAAEKVQAAWEKGDALAHQERGEVTIVVFSAKSLATKVRLEITNRIFEVMGTRSTAAQHGFDRASSDLRTSTIQSIINCGTLATVC